jgi:hypothetical protein
MAPTFSLIRKAFAFASKQPVLKQISLWFIWLPLAAMQLIIVMSRTTGEASPLEARGAVIRGIVIGSLGLVLLFGILAILVVGDRLLQSRAGRTRTSLKGVVTEVRDLYFPLLLTSLLRGLISLLLALPLLIPLLWLRREGLLLFPPLAGFPFFALLLLGLAALPALLFSLLTMFFLVVLVHERQAYMRCLWRSISITRKRFWYAVSTLLLFVLVFLVPLELVTVLLAIVIPHTPLALIILWVFISFLASVSVTLSLLSLILLFGEVRGGTHHGTFVRG